MPLELPVLDLTTPKNDWSSILGFDSCTKDHMASFHRTIISSTWYTLQGLSKAASHKNSIKHAWDVINGVITDE